MKVKDIMTKDVISVTPETSVSEVANILLTNRFHSVPVVAKGKVVGIVTESDFFDRKSGRLFLPTYIQVLEEKNASGSVTNESKAELDKLKNMKVKDIMTAGCITVNQEMQLSQLMEVFKKTTFHSLIVTDKSDTLMGIVTLFDVIGLMKI